MTDPYLYTGKTKLMLQVASDLDRHEGFREFAYPDVLSKLFKKFPHIKWGSAPARSLVPHGADLETGAPWTVGYGFTNGVGPDSRMPAIQARRKLEELILEDDAILSQVLSWYEATSFVTKTVLINMMHNLGLKGLLSFKNTIKFVKDKLYTNAAANMRHSLWYKQVSKRAEELARRMETQEIPAQYLAPEKIK